VAHLSFPSIRGHGGVGGMPPSLIGDGVFFHACVFARYFWSPKATIWLPPTVA